MQEDRMDRKLVVHFQTHHHKHFGYLEEQDFVTSLMEVFKEKSLKILRFEIGPCHYLEGEKSRKIMIQGHLCLAGYKLLRSKP